MPTEMKVRSNEIEQESYLEIKIDTKILGELYLDIFEKCKHLKKYIAHNVKFYRPVLCNDNQYKHRRGKTLIIGTQHCKVHGLNSRIHISFTCGPFY